MGFTRTVSDGVATVVMDDGRVNAMDLDFFAGLTEVLDACAGDAAVVLAGRDGMFSAGLNTKVLTSSDESLITRMLVTFGRTMHRVWLEPRPVVAAATGHAVAGGTVLAMACDHAVAAAGDFRWGMVETTIGFAMPHWALAITRGNVAADRLDDLLLPGRAVGPEEAVAVGFADEHAPPAEVVSRAQAHARALADLPAAAYAATKRRLRAPASAASLADVEADTAALLGVR